MGEEETKKVEEEKPQTVEETPKDVAQEKTVIPAPDHKDSDSKPSPADES